jgi:DNA-binding NtrC family response regulator
MTTKASPAVREARPVNHESLQDRLDDTERTEILRALQVANGIVGGPNGAAARLGIKRSTLQLRMQKLVFAGRAQPSMNADARSGVGRDSSTRFRNPNAVVAIVRRHEF